MPGNVSKWKCIHTRVNLALQSDTREPLTQHLKMLTSMRSDKRSRLAELLPSRIRKTVGEFLDVGGDENSTDAVCAEDTVASLPGDVYNSFEGNEDSTVEANSSMGQAIPECFY